MLGLANRIFKAAIINIFKEVKDTKDLKKSIAMTHQEKREIKKTEHKILELKCILTERKYSLERLNSIFEWAKRKSENLNINQ